MLKKSRGWMHGVEDNKNWWKYNKNKKNKNQLMGFDLWDRAKSLRVGGCCRLSKYTKSTYKSRLDWVSKHCSQKSALRGGRTLRAEVERVLGKLPPPPAPAPSDGELIPPPHLFRPPVTVATSEKPALDPDIASTKVLSKDALLWHHFP